MDSVRTVSPAEMEKALVDILHKFDASSKESADKVAQHACYNLFGAIIEETPVGDFDPAEMGKLKGAWVVSQGSPSSSTPNKRMPNRERQSIKSQISSKIISGNVRMFMTNSRSYAGVVEYGGYKKNPKLGTYNKVKKRFEIRSRGGFSKQAPEGMVRRNTSMWKRFVEIAANDIL